MNYLNLVRRVPERSAVEPRSLAWLYDLITKTPLVRAAHRRFVAGALAQKVITGTALDLGTGPGHVAIEIARRRPGVQIVGLDLAAHMVQRANRQAVRAGLDGRGIWSQADGHALPFADGSFDLVISTFALHHWTDPLHILNEIARVLRHPEPAGQKSGGRYYIADLCREPNIFQRLFAYSSVPAVSLAFGSYRGYGGYYESLRAGYTLEEAQDLLAHSNLPPGEVRLDSTPLLPLLTIASKSSPFHDHPREDT
jgi:ubiquinone/menaquinone biosynthesis C-methylase UbiE